MKKYVVMLVAVALPVLAQVQGTAGAGVQGGSGVQDAAVGAAIVISVGLVVGTFFKMFL